MPEEILGYVFRDPQLLKEAFTHPSAGKPFNNQRLEFLGDAVIDLIVAEHLFNKFPDLREGEMTLLKASVVNGSALAKRAKELGLDDRIEVGSALGDRSRWPRSVYRDVFEAAVGAIYLDGGPEAASKAVLETLSDNIEKIIEEGCSKDYKSLLLELAQAGSGIPPVYEVISEEGPPHDKLFDVSVTVNDKSGQGRGKSKKEAERSAAEDLLKIL